jgi:hypothetical protein
VRNRHEVICDFAGEDYRQAHDNQV